MIAGTNLFYIVLFLTGFLLTTILFLVKSRFFIINMLVDLVRTTVVACVFLALTHYFNKGTISFSTIFTYLSSCLIALLLCENLKWHRKKAVLRRKKTTITTESD